MMVVKPSEEVMESLEGHQMELQSMVSVEFFKDKVLQWQITLGNVEEVLKVSHRQYMVTSLHVSICMTPSNLSYFRCG